MVKKKEKMEKPILFVGSDGAYLITRDHFNFIMVRQRLKEFNANVPESYINECLTVNYVGHC